MDRIRVVLADDHPALRLGLRVFFREQPDLDLVGEADDGVEAVRLVRRLRPDILVLDVRLPRRDGIAVARDVLQAVPQTRVLVYTGYHDEHLARSLLRLGVHGYLLKPTRVSELVVALRQVARGGTSIDASLTRQLLRDETASSDQDPTPRELEVLRLIADGQRDRDVARHVKISDRTVHYHVSNLTAKLAAKGRVDLVRRAWDRGWIGPEKIWNSDSGAQPERATEPERLHRQRARPPETGPCHN